MDNSIKVGDLLPYVLRFQRTFTSGVLAGISMADSMRFTDAGRARTWIAGINRNNAAGTVDYKVVQL